jgi:starch synthase
VIDYTQDAMRANGIKFQEYSARALAKAIRKALAIYQQPELLLRYRRSAMKANFSWEQTVGRYVNIYEIASKI